MSDGLGHIGGRRIAPQPGEVAALKALVAARCQEARDLVPRYRARVLGAVPAGALAPADSPAMVIDLACDGRNVTADILDPFLPVGSPFRGTVRVRLRQAVVLARIANDPDGTRPLQDEMMRRLGGRHV